MAPKVLVSDKLSETAVQIFRDRGIDVDFQPDLGKDKDKLAEVGVIFCTLMLVTGPIWAKGTWGKWWSWDPRLTVTLLLWFVYLAYLLLRSFTEGDERAARFASIYGILGVVLIAVLAILLRMAVVSLSLATELLGRRRHFEQQRVRDVDRFVSTLAPAPRPEA